MKKYAVYVDCNYTGPEYGRTTCGRIVEAENETAAAEIALNAVESYTRADALAEDGFAIGITEEDKVEKMYENCKVLAVEEYEEVDLKELFREYGVELAD